MGRRRHGFEWPPDRHQIGAYVVIGALAGLFFGLLAPSVSLRGLSIVLQATYAAFAAGTLTFVVAATRTDARDRGDVRQDYGSPIFHCPYCQLLVKPKTKHCKRCDKCVERFDHHCIWLNNCIGGRNYWMFCGLLACAQTAAAVQLASGIYLLVRSLTAAAATVAHLDAVFRGRISLAALRAIAGFDIGIAGLLSAALAELSCFHIYLGWRRISTYEYIVAQRSLSQQRRCGAALDSAVLAHARAAQACSRHRQRVRAQGLCGHGKATARVQSLWASDTQHGGHIRYWQDARQGDAREASAGQDDRMMGRGDGDAQETELGACHGAVRALFIAPKVAPIPVQKQTGDRDIVGSRQTLEQSGD